MQRFSLPPHVEPRLFAAGHRQALERMVWWPSDAERLDALDPALAPFLLSFNRANCLAYDGLPTPGANSAALGMPRWVFLDCCLLPSLVFGLSVPRDVVPRSLADLLDPEGTCQALGVAEYIALPSLEPGVFIGVSLFSMVEGRRWGARIKATALRALGAQTLIGITQVDRPALRLHLHFGALHVMAAPVPVHGLPDTTIVYRTDLDPSQIEALSQGEVRARSYPDPDFTFSPQSADERTRWLAAMHARPAAIVSAAARPDGAPERLGGVWVEP